MKRELLNKIITKIRNNEDNQIHIAIYLLVFACLFYMGIGNFFDNSLNHNFPANYFAFDQFGHLSSAEALQDQGHFLYLPPHLSKGVEKVLPHYTPGMTHFVVLFSEITGLEVFNGMQLLIAILFILLPFIFIEALPLNRGIKIISLAFTPLMFSFQYVISLLWGQVGSIMGTFFMFSFFLQFTDEKLKKNFLFMSLIISAIIFTHFPEFISLIFFLIIYLSIDVFKNMASYLSGFKSVLNFLNYKQLWKNYSFFFYATIITIIISGFYLVIFYYGNFLIMGGDDSSSYNLRFVRPSDYDAIRTVEFFDFPTILALGIIIGVIFSLFLKNIDAKIILFFMLFISNLNYYAFFTYAEYRAFQMRFFWPFTLAPFFAIFIYFIIVQLPSFSKSNLLTNLKNISKNYFNIISIFIFLFLFFLMIPNIQSFHLPGVISNDQYSAMKFLENKASDNESIVFLYGDGYSQSTMALKKIHYSFPDYFMNEVIQGKRSFYEPILISPSSKHTNAYFDGYSIKNVDINGMIYNKSLCYFDYYVMDRFSKFGNPTIQFNQLFFDSINKESIQLIYNNDQTMIFKRISMICKGDINEN